MQGRFREASTDPAEVVRLFTTSDDVIAEVAEGPNDVWRIRVEGPRVQERRDDGDLDSA